LRNVEPENEDDTARAVENAVYNRFIRYCSTPRTSNFPDAAADKNKRWVFGSNAIVLALGHHFAAATEK
jgi:hypothetical protein